MATVSNVELDWQREPPSVCGCGDHGCWHANAEYYYCAGCGDHHRLPVTKVGVCPAEVQHQA